MELLAVFPSLIAFLIAFLFGKQITDKGCQFATCAAVIVAAFVSCVLFFDVALAGHPRVVPLANWIVSGDFSAGWTLRIDQLTVVMMCVINIVSACVHVYSVGYMSHDPAKGRFMSYLALFTFAMLMLVTSDNLLQLFFGWEGVGLASYLLIGFWNHKPSANAAAVKAFIVNRVGDFGLALGTMAIFVIFGTISYEGIFEKAPDLADMTFMFLGFEVHALTLVCLLLFMGAVGKSAQLGLHTWLPDAMEGPTPVSALIHAATMVTAGVFLVARFSPVFEYAPDALMVVTVVGATTAFVAATIGLTQFDIKRVIAYSTMSQLGYMFFALGVSAYGAAMFHLMTHAFFKALLFLGAGSVIHAMSDEQDMRKMGGIWKMIPTTYVMMWIGSLALAGIPFFAGYYSKDMILEAAFADNTWFGNYAFWMGIAAALMTAFYSWRLILMTFHGKPRADEHVMAHVHESPSIMLSPLVVLASGALVAGYVFYTPFVGGASHGGPVHHVEVQGNEVTFTEGGIPTDEHDQSDEKKMEHDAGHEGGTHDDESAAPETAKGHSAADEEGEIAVFGRHQFWGQSLKVLPENDTIEAGHHVPTWVKLLPVVVGALGIFFAYVVYMWREGTAGKIAQIFAPLHRLFFNKWFFDEIYDRFFVQRAFRWGRFFWKSGDGAIIDRMGPDGFSSLSRRLGAALSRAQSGYMYQYAFIMMVGLIGLISWLIYRVTVGL
ncbi:MAG: NADH-quinone oxidoreductase subunit L [Micavibrio aeruginosavorus]|uniref:NADH-ubiquinone oxidoreductase chain 5 n=1 Tax=Micavibrio aeruginosavorus TaxID=349221 RepID=A0A7T5R0K1_9BACT|nr:MAG: NADH-quinone oxidoreductase subunit L [Micavibrio aeruginosavorus]